ncbi:MAG: methyltransferase dimerization domain-containing protein [Desulfobulbus sp.]|nr:methyltransferase dimerization domain-containing protein [Desulfobulbus sp.]
MIAENANLMRLEVPPGIEQLNQYTEGYQKYTILEAAMNLGVFAYLAEHGPCDREKITTGCSIQGMLMRPFLACLVDMDLLTLDGDLYTNSPITKNFLLTSSPFYQGEWLGNIKKSSQWSDLSAALKGTERKKTDPGAGNGPSTSFIDALGQRALRGELQAVVEKISAWQGFPSARKMLDIGGGHGLYAIALCQENPGLQATVIDRPGVLEVTERNVAHFLMQDRFTLMEGDVCAGNFGKGYDIILISHLLYKFRKNLEPIFETVQACLNPGGLLVTNHWFCASGCVPEKNSVTELSKALQSFGHPLCHENEFFRLLEANGMGPLAAQVVPTPFGPSRLIMAVKGDGRELVKDKQQSCSCCSC